MFSDNLYAYLDKGSANWVIAFDEDGRYYVESAPVSDFWVPVPDAYATREGAEAGLAVIAVWCAPVAFGNDVLPLDALRATPEWAALVPHLPQAIIADTNDVEFAEAADLSLGGGLPGAYEHYRAMTGAGVQVR